MQCDLNKRLDIRFKIIFMSIMIGLLLAHGMAVFNKFSFHDDIWLTGAGGTISLGRWGLEILKNIASQFFGQSAGSAPVYSMPIMSSFYTVIFLSLALYMMVKLLNIKNLLSCSLLSGLFITSLFFTSIFGYMFTVAYYSFSILLSVLGAYLICHYQKVYTYFLGILCMTFSLGIYQAFYPISISLITLFFIKEVMERNFSSKDFIKRGIYYAFTCMAALILYLMTVKLSLFFTNTQLSSYKDINTMGMHGIFPYLEMIPIAYYKFFNPRIFFPFNTIWLYRVVLFIILILILHRSKDLCKESKNKYIQFILLNIILPISINLIYPMLLGNHLNSLVLLCQLMIFPYLFLLLETKEPKERMLQNVGFICCFLIILMFIRWANVFYLKAEFMQQRTINYFTSLIAQIKNTENYKDEYPVVFINEFSKYDKNVQNLPFPQMYLPPYYGTIGLLNNYAWREFLHKWLAYMPNYEEPEKFKKLSEVKNMPRYPDYGSIKVINKTIVVKF